MRIMLSPILRNRNDSCTGTVFQQNAMLSTKRSEIGISRSLIRKRMALGFFILLRTPRRNGKKYRMVNSSKERNPPSDVVFPSNFRRLLIEYQEHPEAKSLAPDGTLCKGDTRGLLKRAHIVAGELRYVGKETDRK